MLVTKSASEWVKMHFQSWLDAPPCTAKSGWAPSAADQPSSMITKFFHNVHPNTNNNFHTYHEVWIGLELHEFALKVNGGQKLKCSIRRRPTTNEGETGGVGFMLRRASKPSRWSQSNRPKMSPASLTVSVRKKTRNFSPWFHLLHLDSWLETGIQLKTMRPVLWPEVVGGGRNRPENGSGTIAGTVVGRVGERSSRNVYQFLNPETSIYSGFSK